MGVNKIRLDTNDAHLIEPTLYAASTLSTNAYSATLTGFELISGATIQIKFPATNPSASPTLNINSTGAKTMYYNNAGVGKKIIKANHVYTLVYDSTLNSNAGGWHVVGDFDTNTQANYGNITTSGTIGSGNNLVVTSSGTVQAGATIASAIETQDQDTKFLREDGTWATPSYTTNTDHYDWDDITSKPTTLSGYGITDAASSTHDHNTIYYKLDGSNTGTKLSISTQSAAHTNGICFMNSTTKKGSIGTDSNGVLGLYSATKVVLRPQLDASTKGVEVTTSAMYPTASITLGTSTDANKWSTVYATTYDGSVLKLHQGAGANPSLTGNARIEFDCTSGQPVVISYTPKDSYRAPAGLKIMGGTSATPAWFEVEGSIFANGGYRIPHTGNTTGTIGADGTPIYVDAGEIKAGTALGTMAYETATDYATVTTVDGLLAAADAMIFKGTLGTNGTITALPDTHEAGWTYRVITAGTYAGKYCEVGTLIICVKDGTAAADADWTSVETNEDGAVIGPAAASSTTDNAVVRWDSTVGRTIKNSSTTINDRGTMTIKGKLIVNPSYDTSTNSFNEGVRINQASNGWAEVYLGGAADSTSQQATKAWLVARRGVAGSKAGAVGDFTIEQGSDGDGLTLHNSSGGMTLYTNKSNSTPCFTIKNAYATTANGYSHIMEMLSPNMVANSNNVILIGAARSAKNMANFGFHYDGSGSNDNYAKIGLWGADNLLIVKPDGKVGIGTTTPSYTLSVNGDVSATNFRGALVGNASSATQVAATLAATTKHFLLGTSTTLTGTAANVSLLGDGGIYATTTSGELSAVNYSYNVSGTEKAYTCYNSTDNSIDFIFI